MRTDRLRQNNFDLLRFVFASIVCLVHAYVLSGNEQLRNIATWLSSKVAVEAFFVVSGLLIFMSYENSKSLRSYIEKRLRRIYPAYFAVVTLGALILCCASVLSSENYFSWAWLKYLAANLAFVGFLHEDLPGVFTQNNVHAVNGALWTLKVEVMFYCCVPFIATLFKRYGRFRMMLILYLGSYAYASGMNFFAEKTGSNFYHILERQLPGQMMYFIAGASVFYFLPLFTRRISYFLSFAVLTLLIDHFYPLPALEPLAIAVVVAAMGLYCYLGNFGKFGDFSYGVYILHFPILQLLVQQGWFKQTPWLDLCLAFCMVVGSAYILWHLVEKRFLARRSHYLAATHTATT